MNYGVDWSKAREGWTALWAGRHQGRPCMTVMAPNGRKGTCPPPASGEQRWLDPDWLVRSFLDQFETTYYAGEAFPSGLIMAGWAVNTYGAVPRFPQETIWFEPIAVDWDRPPTFDLDWNSPWLRKVEALHEAVLAAAGRDNFLVGSGCFLPGSDMLAMIIGTEPALLAMAERPAWTRASILKLAANVRAIVKHFFDLARRTHDFWYGCPGWMPFWSPEPFIGAQADISCMMSPEMFETFIVPELDLDGREFGHVWYHLDGQSAFQHLPRLLSLRYIKVIQFTPMSGTPANGPDYLDLYRQIQAAGKIVHIQTPVENIESLCRALDPGLLCIDATCRNPKDADDLLAAAVRWTQTRSGPKA
jgi:hypothetical protein